MSKPKSQIQNKNLKMIKFYQGDDITCFVLTAMVPFNLASCKRDISFR